MAAHFEWAQPSIASLNLSTDNAPIPNLDTFVHCRRGNLLPRQRQQRRRRKRRKRQSKQSNRCWATRIGLIRRRRTKKPARKRRSESMSRRFGARFEIDRAKQRSNRIRRILRPHRLRLHIHLHRRLPKRNPNRETRKKAKIGRFSPD